MPNLPPPGWYDDPSGEATHRWFDGHRWTTHVSGTERFAPMSPNPAEAALGAPRIETVPPIGGPRAMVGTIPAPAHPAYPPQPAAFDPALYWVLPIGRSWQAVAAGYLGLLAVLPFVGIVFGLAAVVIGVWALALGSPDPQHGGRGRPIFGIVSGSVFSLLWICIVVASLIS